MAISFTAGQTLRASDLAKLVPQYIAKSEDQTVTNSTTLVDGEDLSFEAEANSVYEVFTWLAFGALEAADARVAWSSPTGANVIRHVLAPYAADAALTDPQNIPTMSFLRRSGTTQQQTGGTGTADFTLYWEYTVIVTGATAGTCKIQWAQQTVSATGSILKASSSLTVRRLS